MTDDRDRVDDSPTDEPRFVQDAWPDLSCFGCGPANPHGLRLKSEFSADGTELVATYDPDERFTSGAPNVAYGGLVASLVDCHAIWTAIAFAHRAEGRAVGTDPRIAYVTANLSVDFRKPTPLDQLVHLQAWVDGDAGEKTTVVCEVGTGEELTAEAEVLAVRAESGLYDHS